MNFTCISFTNDLEQIFLVEIQWVFTPKGGKVPSYKGIRNGFHAYLKDVLAPIQGERGPEGFEKGRGDKREEPCRMRREEGELERQKDDWTWNTLALTVDSPSEFMNVCAYQFL